MEADYSVLEILADWEKGSLNDSSYFEQEIHRPNRQDRPFVKGIAKLNIQ